MDNSKSTTGNKTAPFKQRAVASMHACLADHARNNQFVAAFPFCLMDIPLSLTDFKIRFQRTIQN